MVGITMGQSKASRTLAFCAVFLIAALYVVGVVSHGVLRHVVQTAPMRATVVFLLTLAVQVLALRVSFLPGIAHD
jgi:cytochrome bd-type quinol oxidase subunit 2